MAGVAAAWRDQPTDAASRYRRGDTSSALQRHQVSVWRRKTIDPILIIVAKRPHDDPLGLVVLLLVVAVPAQADPTGTTSASAGIPTTTGSRPPWPRTSPSVSSFTRSGVRLRQIQHDFSRAKMISETKKSVMIRIDIGHEWRDSAKMCALMARYFLA